MSNSNNFFNDAFKHWGEWNNTQNKWANWDVQNVTNFHKRNAETVAAASQVAAEGVRAMMSMQAQMVQANASEAFQVAKECAVPGNHESALNKQGNYLKSVVESTLSHSRDLMDLAVRSGMEVFDLVSNRVSENMNELMANSCQAHSHASAKKKASAS